MLSPILSKKVLAADLPVRVTTKMLLILRIVASNPCNSSTATIEPIEISEPPDPQFAIIPPPISCAGGIYSFENNTTNINEVISGNPSECIDVLKS